MDDKEYGAAIDAEQERWQEDLVAACNDAAAITGSGPNDALFYEGVLAGFAMKAGLDADAGRWDEKLMTRYLVAAFWTAFGKRIKED